MIQKILEIKPFTLFFWIFLAPFLLCTLALNWAFNAHLGEDMIIFLPFVMLYFMVGANLWYIAIFLGFRGSMSEENRPALFGFFLGLLVYVLAALVFYGVLAYLYACTVEVGWKFPVGDALGTLVFSLLVSYGLMFLSRVYFLLRVAKVFKTVDLGKDVSFSDYLGEWILLYFFPLAAWILQAKIRAKIQN